MLMVGFFEHLASERPIAAAECADSLSTRAELSALETGCDAWELSPSADRRGVAVL